MQTRISLPSRLRPALPAAALLAMLAGATLTGSAADSKPADGKTGKPAATRAALTVEAVTAQSMELPTRIAANGNIAAWQEAVIGAEVSGLRLAEVRVNVGDTVRAGAVLAVFASEAVLADLALQRASLAEAEAAYADAKANAGRARDVQASGALSAQQVGQLLTAESTARARVEAARAQVQSQELRLRHTRVLAPDHGTISARTATVGAVAQPGQDLFRMIRQGRLEWRAEVPAADVHRVKPGQNVRIDTPAGTAARGRVRIVGPTVDTGTRNALVYADLAPGTADLKAGMFVRGDIDMGAGAGLVLPQSAILLREGFAYVYRIGDDNRVQQLKVTVGRRDDDRVEILSGLAPAAKVVKSGVAFLADGDTVKVSASNPPAKP